MLYILFIFFFFFLNINCIIDYYDNSDPPNEYVLIKMEAGLAQTHFIEYRKNTNLSFNIKDNENYQINIHSINCNIKIDFDGEIMNQININSYSLKINSTNNNIIIKPVIDIIDGEEKENYDNKTCPLSINSININQPQIKIENKIDSVFFFEDSNFDYLNISYKIKEKIVDNFVALHFQFDENCIFSIDVDFNNKKNIIYKNIENSGYIFLNSEILGNSLSDYLNGNLSINIKKIDNKNINMRFRIIEKEMVSMLQKNALNYGFVTSKTKYQYYYIDVFEGEEGEIILHNKRLYGELYAKIVNKSQYNIMDLYNSSIYPKEVNNSTYLNYNPHSLKLKYYSEITENCVSGCYILITYEQKISVGDFPLIGYEFTLLSRSWNSSDYISNIVDIPFNEYLIGAFEKGSITHHYYSISIPDDTEKLIIQIEGNFIEGYYGEGRKRVNTVKKEGKVEELEIINNQNVLTLEKNKLKFKKKTISFAIRPKDYYSDIFSFYYFRILYVKKNEILYLPMDSNFGNLCLPEYDSITKSYYCYSKLENNFNELTTNFSVSSSNQNEYFEINTTTVYKNGNIINASNLFIFLNNDETNDVDHYIFKFIFRNDEIRNIISSFNDKIETFSPQIYSPQMIYLYNFTKKTNFDVKNNYTLNYKYIYGETGYIELSFLGTIRRFHSNKNFKGRPFAFPIDSKTKDINFTIANNPIMFYFQLLYNRKNKAVEELNSGEAISQIMAGNYFPLYYYVKIKNQNYANVDVNLRLSSYNETDMQNSFDVKGYMLDEDTIKRKINGEYIQLKEPINGNYSEKFRIGFIQVNQKIDNNKYLLIEINNNDQLYVKSYMLIDLITREYNDESYFMPINQYIYETFDGENKSIRTSNEYEINIFQKKNSDILIEYSPEYNDIELEFTNINSTQDFRTTGFIKYRIRGISNDIIKMKIINKGKRMGNYMIRYFFTTENLEQSYSLDKYKEKKYINSNDENVTLSLTFNSIKIHFNYKKNENRTDMYFYVYGLLYKKDENIDELLNTTSILHEQIPLYEDKVNHTFNYSHPEEFELIFKDIPRQDNFIYNLQLQVSVNIKDNILNEEFLIFNFDIDLSDIKIEEEKEFPSWAILVIIFGSLIFIGIIFLIIKYIRLQKRNVKMQEEMKSMAYSNEIEKNVIAKEKKVSKSDTDYDTTFI